MFGIALGISAADFKQITRSPRSVGAGVVSQFILLPLFTFLLIWLIEPHPALALGMILVAACPGGNVSNFISSISGANIALSVSLTGIATLLCPILTPFNFHFWAGILPETAELLRSFDIPFLQMLQTVLLVLVLPLVLGMYCKARLPALSAKIEKPVRWLSFLLLMAFIGIALVNNFSAFKSHLYLVFLLVLAHNAMAFALGYYTGRLTRIPEADCRSLSIETGIQNSGLGLIIIFTFFGGNGAMALVAAWWGVWHILGGLILAYFFKRKPIPLAQGTSHSI